MPNNSFKQCQANVVHSSNINVFQARIVNNSEKKGYDSPNWRADYHKFKGSSYAQVVKLAPRKKVVDTSSNFQSCSQRAKNKWATSTGQESQKLRQTAGESYKKLRHAKNIRVSTIESSKGITTHNRFEILANPMTIQENDPNTTAPETLDATRGTKPTRVKQTAAPIKRVHPNIVGDTSNHEYKDSDKAIVQHTQGDADDKYSLTLTNKSRFECYKPALKECKTTQKWDSQNKTKFGFIPLGDLTIPTAKNENHIEANPLQMHEIIKQSGKHNFLDCQIMVKSQLNPKIWESLLKNYWDQQLIYLIKHGFPLDFDHSSPLSDENTNHNSALQYPNDIQAYLKEETQFKAILGPFTDPPLPNSHHSPFMTREKPGAPHRRVIIDLSYPKGQSINAGISKDTYLGTPFILTLPTIDTVTSAVKRWGRGCHIYKLDISRAFRHIKLDPGDYNLLGLRHYGHYVDTCLPFGYRHGSAIFQRISDAIRHIMTQRNYDVINYIDDVIGVGLPSVTRKAFPELQSLVRQLGFDVSVKKLVAPSTQVNCLGIIVDTKKYTVSVPHEKLAEIIKHCNHWKNKPSCTKRELQSLLGRLLYISKCVKASRYFLNRMLALLRQMGQEKSIELTLDFFQDLNWFIKFLAVFNGTVFFDHRPIKANVQLDACLKGMGGRWNDAVYKLTIHDQYQDFTIVHLEMLNLLVAIRLWGKQWASHKVVLHCDNQAVVSVLTNGRTCDRTLAAIARNIKMHAAILNINLITIHILGKNNSIADLLSRWDITTNPHERLYQMLPNHTFTHVPDSYLNIDWSI